MVARYLLPALAGLFTAVLAQTVTYQAEDATLTGTTVGSSVAGFSGTGYVEGFDTDGDQIRFTVTATESKLYDIVISYAGPYGDKYTNVVLNNAGGSQVFLPANNAFSDVAGGQVLLKVGDNTIDIRNNWGWYLIDAIKLTPSAPRPPHQISTTPANPAANADAKALLSYLGSIYGKKILSGQQDQASLDWVTTNVGKTPAILGVDLMDYTDSRMSRGGASTDVDKAIAHAAKGGIVTFVWHWGAPSKLIDTPEHPWYSGFYTDATTFDIAAAMADTTNDDYQLLMHDIDTIAVQLKKLQAAGVPVIWRPLHEAEGGWFWWGAKGAEPCKKLWNVLYDRLTNYHGLNNLLWEWNSVATAWYPGDATVDLLSADTYSQGDHGPISATYNNLLALGKDKKIIAAAEIGSLMEPDQLIAYQADWVYFCVWSGDYIQGSTWNPIDLVKRVYAHDYVLTLDEIQGWKGPVAPPSSSAAPPSSTTFVTSVKPSPSSSVAASSKPASITSITPPKSSSSVKPTTSSVKSTSSAKPTSSSVKTSSTKTSSSAAPSRTPVPKYGQCGGLYYNGPTPDRCAAGSTCQKGNDYYWQCL